MSEINSLPVGRWSTGAKEQIERGIACLWEKRKELLRQPDGIAAVKDSLLFRKYNIASPGMVEQINKIIQRAPHFRQPELGNKLPAALVYGEAGAGKDTMARLIQLFTPSSWRSDKEAENVGDQPLGYFGLKTHAINMSALKPNALFGPLFQGINVSDPHLSVPSILTRHDNNTNSDEPNRNSPGFFILDELNSLDVDLQGVLLRILENGEVTPLFDIKPSYVKHLIIGVINEDPEVLTRESESTNLKRIKDFTGEFIGNALYEFFIKGRRLRPDLFYRLSRSLYIRLPSLRERRDDIPILFYFECEDAVKQELKNTTINNDKDQREPWASSANSNNEVYMYVELRAYESLMRRSLDWPGNVRQLQAVAMEVAVESVKKYLEPDSRKNSGIVYVGDETVCEVLSHHFPSAFEERAGNKSNGRSNHGRKE